MDYNLKLAKTALALSKDPTNAERVLAEIIRMSKIKKGLSTKEMVAVIPGATGISESLFRKTMHDLYKTDIIIKQGLVYINPKYLTI